MADERLLRSECGEPELWDAGVCCAKCPSAPRAAGQEAPARIVYAVDDVVSIHAHMNRIAHNERLAAASATTEAVGTPWQLG